MLQNLSLLIHVTDMLSHPLTQLSTHPLIYPLPNTLSFVNLISLFPSLPLFITHSLPPSLPHSLTHSLSHSIMQPPVSLMRATDVLITPHGAALTNLIFLQATNPSHLIPVVSFCIALILFQSILYSHTRMLFLKSAMNPHSHHLSHLLTL